MYHLNTKSLTLFQNARGIVESESKRNRKIRIPKGIRPSEMLHALHKVKRPTENKTCNSGTKDAHIHPLSCFINNRYGFWKLTFGHQVKVKQKVRKSVYNIKRYFKQFFTFLERTSTFIISLFRTIYRGSYPDVFTKKSFLLQVVLLFKAFSGWLLLYVWKWMQHVPTRMHLFRVKIEILQSTKLTIKTLEELNLRRFGALIVNRFHTLL